MRRSVEEAIRVVRQTFSGPFADRPGPAWEHAKTLVDEVERLHARLAVATTEAGFALAIEQARAWMRAGKPKTRFVKATDEPNLAVFIHEGATGETLMLWPNRDPRINCDGAYPVIMETEP